MDVKVKDQLFEVRKSNLTSNSSLDKPIYTRS